MAHLILDGAKEHYILDIEHGEKVRRCRQKKLSYRLYAPNQKVSIEDYEEETQL